MAVNEDPSAYSTTASGNTPAGTDSIGPDLDNHLRDMKKNQRAALENFKTVSGGAVAGAFSLDDSASPTWTMSVIDPSGTAIEVFDVDVSAGTSTPYAGSGAVGSFAQGYLEESTASARTTIMGSLLGVVAGEASTASASHRLAALGIGPTIGTVDHTIYSTTPDGWLPLHGETLGNVSASATHVSSMYEILYTRIWDSTTNSEVAVEGGRGASAAADWAANKNLTLPDGRGRGVIGTGTGSGLSARTNADTGGEEEHLLTGGESGVPPHTHNIPARNSSTSGSTDTDRVAAANDSGGTFTFSNMSQNSNQNAASAHNNMQPFIAFYPIIKF